MIKTLKPEKKMHITYPTGTVTTAGVVYDLCQVPPGTSSNQRVGMTIQPVVLNLKVNAVIADTYNIIRCIVFRWIDDDTVNAPLVTDILLPTPSVLQFPNQYQTASYQILMDKRWILNNYSAHTCLFSKKLKLKKLIRFNGSGTTGFGHIYVLLISDSGSASHPVYTIASRLDYYDS